MPDLDPAIRAVFDATDAGDSAASGSTVVGVVAGGKIARMQIRG